MYEAMSKKNPTTCYVIDEFGLHADEISDHPRLEHHGEVLETLEVSLKIPPDKTLRDILDDFNRFPVNQSVGRGDYPGAIIYIQSILNEDALKRRGDMVSVHRVDTSKLA